MPQVRDLSIIDVPSGCVLTSCDISAGFGEKQHDSLVVTPELTGQLTLRVALLEMIASGAEVVAVSDVVGAEMESTGRRIIAGLKQELRKANLEHIELNGSTEENVEVTVTSVGVLVTGFATRAALKITNVHQAAVLFAFGEPIVGTEVLEKMEQMPDYTLVKRLIANSAVMEVVPVGSKGMAFEANLLAETNDCIFIPDETLNEAKMSKTAGPASVILAAVRADVSARFWEKFPSAKRLGDIRRNEGAKWEK
ncbi:AIR synthase related protein [Listeria ivanovii]|uniref:PurM-like N-terminal domain-containing protein n=1 Tax=Listeria ivanovii (strain ATCC BAA-678 / PAM 55) TaxID=881621 RepID=G2ZEQ0_LISIP|nr:AIR synthase related protein [Listeria ivanovii]AHI55625.1 alpha-L-fucosidase [Listeria ivanovii WSLC3009]AIS65077.1 alpha-L-fucosidase [Listeria ivanovii subsp. ivanovii]MBC1758198.1 alpha-L-fucosidase [Listeria ivanovii]MCJ1716133.1 alpha-L-fucosidase [Listeria ivanovii]MCJ1721955.1 alpha-L-fucosidase [Listeria ivanovii]